MIEVAKMLGADESIAEEQMSEVADFESKIGSLPHAT